MRGVSEINGLAESQAKIFPTVSKLQLWRFCTAVHFTEVPAWIPGSLRRTSFGSGPEDNELVICRLRKPSTLSRQRQTASTKRPTPNRQRLRLAASPNAIRHSRPRERGTSGECRESMPECRRASTVQNARQYQDQAVPDYAAAHRSRITSASLRFPGRRRHGWHR